MCGQQSRQCPEMHRLVPTRTDWLGLALLVNVVGSAGPPWGASPDPVLRARSSQVLQPKSALGTLALTLSRESPSFRCWEDCISIPLNLGLAR